MSFTGIGPAQVGMSTAELGSALGAEIGARNLDPGCDYVDAQELPGVSFMIVEDRLVRLDVDTTGVRTLEGAQVGDPANRIKALYPGRVQVEPHKYTDGQYLIVTPNVATPEHRIIFETSEERVVRYRAGRLPEVQWVEGCA